MIRALPLIAGSVAIGFLGMTALLAGLYGLEMASLILSSRK